MDGVIGASWAGSGWWQSIQRTKTVLLPIATRESICARLAAYNIFHTGLHQAFEEDVFHADPHAGNIAVLPRLL